METNSSKDLGARDVPYLISATDREHLDAEIRTLRDRDVVPAGHPFPIPGPDDSAARYAIWVTHHHDEHHHHHHHPAHPEKEN